MDLINSGINWLVADLVIAGVIVVCLAWFLFAFNLLKRKIAELQENAYHLQGRIKKLEENSYSLQCKINELRKKIKSI